MKRKKSGKIGKITGFFCHLCGFIMTAVLFITCVMCCLSSLISKPEIHMKAMENPVLMSAQQEMIHAAIDEQAEKWGFDPANIYPLFDDDAIRGYAGEMARWFTAAISGEDVGTAPYWNDSRLVTSLKADPGLQENAEKAMLASIARDEIAPSIARCAEKVIFPVWTPVVTMGINMAKESLPYTRMVAAVKAVPAASLAAFVVLALLTLVLCHKRISESGKFIGSSMIGAGLLDVALWAVMALTPAKAAMAELSPVGEMWLSSLGNVLGMMLAAMGAVLVCGGIALMVVRQHNKKEAADG